MFEVIGCAVHQHNKPLALFALVICAFACAATVLMLRRAEGARGRRRRFWTLAASLAFGSGVWTTHFVAMLAYEAAGGLRFGAGLTLASLLLACLGSALAFALYLARPRAPLVAGAAGLVLGGSVALMHFTGMAALRIDGVVLFARGPIFAALGLAVGFGAASMVALSARRSVLGGGLLALCVAGLHFTAMDAVQILPLAPASGLRGLGGVQLAMVVGGVAMALLLVCLAGVLCDQRLTRRSLDELARLRQLADSSFEGLLVTRDGIVTNANMALCHMLGTDTERVVGRDVRALLSAHGLDGAVLDEWPAAPVEASLRDCEGRVHAVEMLGRSLSQGRQTIRTLAIRDVTERQRAERRIHQLAHYDTLTGLANRRLLDQRLDDAIAQARNERGSVALLCLDLDGFKLVNDVHGHPAGDKLLVQVGERLRGLLRESDTAGRIGGDEFAIILPGFQTAAAATAAAGTVAALRAPYLIQGHSLELGTSIGVATYPADGTSASSLLHSADVALYRSKHEGGNCFSLFEPEMEESRRAAHALELDLRDAIASDGLQVHYQPLFDSGSLEIIGYEALARWQHPSRGWVPPAEFIPVAERSGLIGRLGLCLLRAACAEAATWPACHTLAVNLSPAQFRLGRLAEDILAVVAGSGLDPRRLELEITEGVLIENSERALQELSALKSAGIRVALDDFGTGYSSLSYLRRFPFDKIKIDRSFVQGMGEDPNADAIVRSIISLGRSLHLDVTAEGVETEAQLASLRAQACGQVQGFLLGRPRAASQLVGAPQAPAPAPAIMPPLAAPAAGVAADAPLVPFGLAGVCAA